MAKVACNLCNAPTSVEEGTTYTAEELEQAAARGFGPPESAIRAALSAGWSQQQVMARWRQQLAESATPYWLLCPACAARAARYLGQPAHTGLQPARLPDRETPRYMPKAPAAPAGAPAPPWVLPEEHTPTPGVPPEIPPWAMPAAPAARPAIRPISARPPPPSTPAAAAPAFRSVSDGRPPPPVFATAESVPTSPAPPPPPPGLSAERSALARRQVTPRSHSRDPLMIGTIIIVVGLAIGLIFIVSGRFQPSGAPTPFPTLRATDTPGPTRQRATPRPSSTLSATAKALLQTRAALPDLAAVTLTIEDMPQGFVSMSSADLADWGLSGSDFEQPMSGTIQAIPHNPAGFAFVDPPSFEYVFCYLIYPLTEREQADFDEEVSDPQLAISLSASLPAVQGRRNVAPLPGGDRFGDKSAGYSLLGQTEGNVPVRLDMLLIRRGAVVAVIQVGYLDGTVPPLTAVKAAAVLDEPFARAMGPIPTPDLSLTPTAVITATPAPLPDLAGVALEVEDLPAGFQRLSVEELADMGLAGGDPQLHWGVSQGAQHNEVGFIYGSEGKYQQIVSLLVYPLTQAEQAYWDQQLSDPASFAASFAQEGWSTPAPLPGGDRFGQALTGVTMVGETSEGIPIRWETLIARRGAVLEFIRVYHVEAASWPPISTTRLAEILDDRLARVLSGGEP